MDEEARFLAALEADEDDEATRLVYADWLDEHDRPEDADRQRKWSDAKRWLIGLVRRINYCDFRLDEDGEWVLDARGNPVPVDPDDIGEPHTYADVIRAGHDAVSGEGYCFGTDEGADFFRESEENRREFFRHWSVVTGVPVPGEVVDDPPFSCAC